MNEKTLVLWKRINFLFLFLLWSVALVLTVGDLLQAYEQYSAIFMERMIVIWSVFIVLFLGVVLAAILFSNRKWSARKIVKISIFSVVSPVFTLPFINLIQTDLAFTLFVIMIVSLLLQRINWNQTIEYIKDAKIAFMPQLKVGYQQFQELRRGRNE